MLPHFESTGFTRAPLAPGENIGNWVFFKNMGRQMAYLPAILTNNGLVPICNPLILDGRGNVKYANPESKKISHQFTRKYPILFPRVYNPRCADLIGGRFQVSDNKEFRHSKDLFVIETRPDMQVRTVKTKQHRGKYVRYVFPPVNYAFKSGPALIKFYDSNFREIKGKHISSEGVTEDNMNQIFDDDLLSYVSCVQYEKAVNFKRPDVIVNKAAGDSLWIGLELYEAATIAQISYSARNDKNGIYPGMEYELFYWNKNNWHSLGIKSSSNLKVCFSGIPSGALLWLRNLDEGKDERIFIIEQNKIIWM